MDEKYPKSELIKIKRSFKLTESQELALTKILTLEGMQTAIEQGMIEAAALLKPSAGEGALYTILPESAAKQLIEVFKATKTKPQISSKQIKISEFIFWFTFQGVNHAYIPMSPVAELLLTNPEKCEQLREFITKNAEAIKILIDLRAEILALNNLPPSRLNERQKYALEISKKLLLPQVTRPLIHIISNEIIGDSMFR